MKRIAVVAAVAVALLASCARDEPRAAGITERWLTAIGDQGRENLVSKSRARALKYGRLEPASELIPPNAESDERHFSDLEVGRAIETGDTARVPYRVTARLEGDETEERAGTAVLSRRGNGWFVVDVDERAPGERVPSEGGARPASATAGQWATALAIGVAAAVASALVIRRQPESTIGAGPG